MPNRRADDPKLIGEGALRIVPGTRLHRIYGGELVFEGYFCNYELNPTYAKPLEAAGMRFAALGPEGEARAIELPEHRFFLASLFQPSLNSRPGKPHPVINAFLRAAAAFRDEAARNAAVSA